MDGVQLKPRLVKFQMTLFLTDGLDNSSANLSYSTFEKWAGILKIASESWNIQGTTEILAPSIHLNIP